MIMPTTAPMIVALRSSVGLIVCVALMACANLRADTVTLTNGKVLEGRVTEDGDKIIVELPFGVIKLNRSQVRSIVTKATVQDELAERRAALQKKLAEETPPAKAAAQLWFELAKWAGERELTHAQNELLRTVIALDSEHAGARKAQGYVQHNGRWMSRAERNQALGFVQIDKKWISPEALADLQRLREAKRQKELKQRQESLKLRARELDVKRREAELQRF
jgi:hypothetical protein